MKRPLRVDGQEVDRHTDTSILARFAYQPDNTSSNWVFHLDMNLYIYKNKKICRELNIRYVNFLLIYTSSCQITATSAAYSTHRNGSETSGVTVRWHVGQNTTGPRLRGRPSREGCKHTRILTFIIVKFVSRLSKKFSVFDPPLDTK